MFYYLYRITNKVNNKIYVGVHMTNNINDGYMGSGRVIKSAIEKHGIDNFHKDILEFFENAETMYAKEKEVVTDEFLLREDVYNLRRGGHGGFEYINKNKLHGFSDRETARKGRAATDDLMFQRYGENWRSVLGKLGAEVMAENLRKKIDEKPEFLESLKKNAKRASDAARNLASAEKRRNTLRAIGHQQGSKNSQYGKCWIWCDFIEGSKSIRKELLALYLEQGWIKGRKIK